MRVSLRFLLSGIVIGFLIIIAGSLAVGFIYSRYQSELDRTIEERIADLEVIRNTLYDPIFYFRVYLTFGELGGIFLKAIAKSPDIVFLRVLRPDGTVLFSSIEKEAGEIFHDLPVFTERASLRKREWQGEPILELSMRGIATENLWMGVSLKPIQQRAFWLAIRTGVGLFLAIVLVAFTLVFLLEKILLSPLLRLHRVMEEVRRGNLTVKVPIESKNEIGELAETFNRMIQDLRESQAALEEAKTVLEIKVAARTRELRELVEKQEEIIKERTKEIQERMAELERFQKLVVGRELKMIQLKKEIKKLRENLDNNKELWKKSLQRN